MLYLKTACWTLAAILSSGQAAPQSRNLTESLEDSLEKRGSVGGVTMSIDSNWQTKEAHKVYPLEQCIRMWPPYDQSISSIGPDQNTWLSLYHDHDCTDQIEFGQDIYYPGIADLSASPYGPAGMNDRIGAIRVDSLPTSSVMLCTGYGLTGTCETYGATNGEDAACQNVGFAINDKIASLAIARDHNCVFWEDYDCKKLHTPQLDGIYSSVAGICSSNDPNWSLKMSSFKCCSGPATGEFCPGHGFGSPYCNWTYWIRRILYWYWYYHLRL